MAQMRKMLVLICSIDLVLLSSCKNSKNEPIVTGEPTLEEIHANGTKTLNGILLGCEKSIQGEEEISKVPQSKTPLRGYKPMQRTAYCGSTRDHYLAGKPQLRYLSVDLYRGYYLVNIHSIVLEVEAKPFTKYEQVGSPRCGYTPTTYTDTSHTMPNRFNDPIKGCFNDGYQTGGRQYLRTYYIKIAYNMNSEQVNRTLPDYPQNFEWNVVCREAE